jgi:hypothetical protein
VKPPGRSRHDPELRVPYANPPFGLPDLRSFRIECLNTSPGVAINCRGSLKRSLAAQHNTYGAETYDKGEYSDHAQYDRLGE